MSDKKFQDLSNTIRTATVKAAAQHLSEYAGHPWDLTRIFARELFATDQELAEVRRLLRHAGIEEDCALEAVETLQAALAAKTKEVIELRAELKAVREVADPDNEHPELTLRECVLPRQQRMLDAWRNCFICIECGRCSVDEQHCCTGCGRDTLSFTDGKLDNTNLSKQVDKLQDLANAAMTERSR